ncbi:hypothetical protein KCU89_g94, partial [Aureobasidium melanogenum]
MGPSTEEQYWALIPLLPKLTPTAESQTKSIANRDLISGASGPCDYRECVPMLLLDLLDFYVVEEIRSQFVGCTNTSVLLSSALAQEIFDIELAESRSSARKTTASLNDLHIVRLLEEDRPDQILPGHCVSRLETERAEAIEAVYDAILTTDLSNERVSNY